MARAIQTNWRLSIILAGIFLFGAIIGGRLVFVQIFQYGFYKALAQGQQTLQTFSQGDRGRIFAQDKAGNRYVLAMNQQRAFAFLSPAEMNLTEAEKEKFAEELASILMLEKAFVKGQLEKDGSLYELLKRDLALGEQQSLETLGYKGLYVGAETVRAYPQEMMAAHVVGFTNTDGIGQYGVEGYFDEELRGIEGIKMQAKNPAGYLLSVFRDTAQDGSDVALTLDYNIQAEAEKLLKRGQEQLRIEGGSIVVMEPASGKILAMASVPNFDLNNYGSVDDLKVFQNPVIQTVFEPGSIFKPITMAAALDEGVVTPETSYEDTGIVEIGGRTVYNYDRHVWGRRTMTEVLQYSINTGAVFAERELGHRRFLQYLEKFGFFEPTFISMAGEVASANAEFQKGYEINFATAAFGQGIEMTQLQMMRAFSALANNGILPQPFIVEGKREERQSGNVQVVSSKAASEVTAMLVNVVQNGYGKSAGISGYWIAGKTGTAQVPWSALGINQSGYSDKTIQSFIGYAPAYSPRFLILVKLDNPAAQTAEYSAAPIFRDMAKYIIEYYQIPPDYEVE
ncbi:MAG: hypothetical protein A3E07_00930 [Candidatus Wildermuthbacteria bacterium RIFCSPHIGHO2_12_FULL_45_9]|uniref:Penicillin-binding protein transpeptidase domain-containing protein n=1 Tax=Candidatus Wildermuthbacteria bacterium RIFCSPHIGHO2_02_FULL_45_25 TaxID=1802450 RepID=A0A1G2R152_9BACT|nr:MAG: hypothetical protein A2748_00840 [Candidatus Wildermuthbacteria bacterium RIFCSPHIGHO2_01_FULL_45_20]OHA66427.1 MAG: hypothetical protein A3C04_01210 [Candidatus Wildermuthbacteria bacterium RIFCSPHIGHO2_02_FULL_45_25]OHA71435.1 MAG: hypothetical protein A3E07_00930 [Candidatus Wildermuthbacteria bacterium RIFCSPHIGHO2_12_FULL_45_9]